MFRVQIYCIPMWNSCFIEIIVNNCDRNGNSVEILIYSDWCNKKIEIKIVEENISCIQRQKYLYTHQHTPIKILCLEYT